MVPSWAHLFPALSVVGASLAYLLRFRIPIIKAELRNKLLTQSHLSGHLSEPPMIGLPAFVSVGKSNEASPR